MRRIMVVDESRCVGCEACVVACKTENSVPAGSYRDWVVQELRGEYPTLELRLRSERCMHCEDAPCVANCPTGASHSRGDGTVQIDREKCTGCRACIASCPYGARFVHPDGYVDKCTLCVHRLDAGLQTACEAACPTSAIAVGDSSDPDSEVSLRLRRGTRYVVTPEAGTRPSLTFVR
ncbi:MAG: 4Fe-4S dicluster domain-containing protein [Deltaproteobacteria bacterium]|nr:4Fe-4S dicluster domain-containing protein [Deltaproteobacteria bacterium]